MSENLKGAIFMMCSMACFAVNNAMIKAFGGMVPMFQTVAFARWNSFATTRFGSSALWMECSEAWAPSYPRKKYHFLRLWFFLWLEAVGRFLSRGEMSV